MKKMYFRNLLLLFGSCFSLGAAVAQVKTNFNNPAALTAAGRFAQSYQAVTIELPAIDHRKLLEAEKAVSLRSADVAKPFQIATPVPVDIDVAGKANWTSDEQFAYGKLTIHAGQAKSLSINFDRFYLPTGTEIFVYNENANMITGPVTAAENNKQEKWGSWVYKGEWITVEVRVPVKDKNELKLHINNVAYGYKEIYKTKVGNFGGSGACNINVLCPLGNGWEAERNSVGLLLDGFGSAFCTGSLLMNTCSAPTPYFLTANHCFEARPDVANWRFTFQAWSPTCTPSQNSDGITFNGSALRANWSATDFCLVELNTVPPANSGIHYAGWSRSTTPATGGVAIHHPRGDVMKISSYTTPLVRADYPIIGGGDPPGDLQWVVQWNQGVTEPGSSGSPLFDQNHRVVGQLGGGPSACGAPVLQDAYGRFDNSWTGGGTSSTRLSDWLDPTGAGYTQTTTTNISNLSSPAPAPAPITYIDVDDKTLNCRFPKIYYTVVGAANATNFKWYTRPAPYTGPWTLVRDGPYSIYVQGSGCSSFPEIKVEASICGSPNVQTAYTETLGCPSCTGNKTTDKTASLLVTPNPASSTVQVQLSGSTASSNINARQESIHLIRIITKTGEVKKVINGNKQATMTFSVSDLPADIYTIMIFDGKKWRNSKLVKQ